MRRRFTLSGLFLALLALSCQLAVGAIVPSQADAAPTLASVSVICHADDGKGGPATPHHSAPDCQFCPLCAAVAAPAPTLSGGPAVPVPVAMAVPLAAPPPQATAPPSVRPLETRPRGPPSQV